jgi:hypothetical protein
MSGCRGHRLDTLKSRRIAGGISVAELARRANLTDEIVQRIESGDTCDPQVTQRILDALAPPVTLTSNTQVSPTVFTASANHNLQTGDTVTIAGVVGANADPNGSRVVTFVSATQFSVAVDCSTAGGTGGTATIGAASVGIARM